LGIGAIVAGAAVELTSTEIRPSELAVFWIVPLAATLYTGVAIWRQTRR
jgi:hypothetical protein